MRPEILCNHFIFNYKLIKLCFYFTNSHRNMWILTIINVRTSIIFCYLRRISGVVQKSTGSVCAYADE